MNDDGTMAMSLLLPNTQQHHKTLQHAFGATQPIVPLRSSITLCRMSAPKQRLLALNLYRNLLRWCRQTPSNLSLVHLNQKIDGVPVETSDDLYRSLRKSFRRENETVVKQGLQQALDGLRLLHSIDPEKLPAKQSTELCDTNHHSTLASFPRDWVEAVEWLPKMEEMKDKPYRPSDLPLFPLSSPVMPMGDQDDSPLPLFSHLTDIPVSGMETPLKIFEPRYREMYKDVLSNGSKQFVVPVAHPYHAGRYAKYGWLYQIVRVEDVADQTQGQIHLVAHHLVTHPIRIDTIVNPKDWVTQSTYLRVQGEVLDETYADSEDLNKIAKTLRELLSNNKEYSSIAGRLLSGLVEGSIWSLVSVWVNWLQMEALEMQVKIAADIQQEAKQTGKETVDNAMIVSKQAPYHDELESLLLEISTLIPLLLQESPKQQCERMLNRIRSRLLKTAT